jgi:cytochrome c oxidase assembly protein subunit 15
MRAPQVKPRTLARLALLNVFLLVAIIVSGAIVRLTNSGLGCANWPNCNATQFVDVATGHAAIEQVNRIFSGLLGIPLGLALLGAYWRVPRRRDLVVLSWVLVVLFLCEAVLGGIAVRVELAWVSITGHFLLAIALVAVGLVVHRRATEASTTYRTVVPRHVVVLARIVYAGTLWVLLLGTLVTATGPHGGDPKATRLDVPLVDVARVHGASVDVLIVLVLVLVVALVRVRAPRRVLNAASCTILVMIAQGIVGYVQYARHLPPLLVGFHVFGAALVFVCVQELLLELRVAAPSEPGADLDRPEGGSRRRVADGATETRRDVARVDASPGAADHGDAVQHRQDGAARVETQATP